MAFAAGKEREQEARRGGGRSAVNKERQEGVREEAVEEEATGEEDRIIPRTAKGRKEQLKESSSSEE